MHVALVPFKVTVHGTLLDPVVTASSLMQAAMARRVREAEGATMWTLTYQLNSKLRMQFNVSSASPHPRTLLFQYSSEAAGT